MEPRQKQITIAKNKKKTKSQEKIEMRKKNSGEFMDSSHIGISEFIAENNK